MGIDPEKVALGIINLDAIAGARTGLGVIIVIGVVPCNLPCAGKRDQGDCQGENSPRLHDDSAKRMPDGAFCGEATIKVENRQR